MALQVLPIALNFRDAKGWIGRTRFHVTVDDTGATPSADVASVVVSIKAAIGGLTNAAFQGSASFDILSPPTLTYGDNLEYPAEWQKAWMMFTTDLGTRHIFKIPAPEIDIFDTDGVTVLNDGTQAQVVAYVNAMKTAVGSAYPSTATGLAFTHFVGGLLKLGKQPKRFNEFIKSSHLVAGEGE